MVPTRDPFEVLGLEPRFELDLAALARRVRELGRALHPDRHATSTAGERRRALSLSIDVNEAERELKDPIRRAMTLRRRLLAEGAPEPAAKVSGAFLMEMMENREALAEARRAGDLAKVRVLAEPVRARETALWRLVGKRLDAALLGDSLDVETLDGELGELRYLRRYLDEVEETLSEH